MRLDSAQVDMDQAIPCGLLVNELISHTLKHAFPAGVDGAVFVEPQPVDEGRGCFRPDLPKAGNQTSRGRSASSRPSSAVRARPRLWPG